MRQLKTSRARIAAVVLIASASACLPGPDGRDGRDGDDAEPCSVTQEPDGAALITCPDGSSARVEPGPEGADGFSTLVAMASEPAGENCATGGVRIESGIDKNYDGFIDETEVSSTLFVCNGRDGEDPAPTLMDVLPVPLGSDCPAGGQRLLAGDDLDGDGELSAAETTVDVVLCQDEAHAALLRLVPFAPGDPCEAGGLRVEIGLDLDDDGVLSDEEATSSSLICHGTVGLPECGDWSGSLLAYVDGTPFDEPTLATVNPTTGEVTSLALLSPATSLGGLAYDARSGLVYATTREHSPQLVSVALDGTVTAIGEIGITSGDVTALAVSPLTGALLATLETVDGEHRLLELSATSGSATFLDVIALHDNADGWDAMAVGPDCDVYATVDTKLYRIDSSTGAAAFVADLGVVLDALVYDGVLGAWVGYWIYEGGEVVTFDDGMFLPQTIGAAGNTFEIRAMTRLPSE